MHVCHMRVETTETFSSGHQIARMRVDGDANPEAHIVIDIHDHHVSCGGRDEQGIRVFCCRLSSGQDFIVRGVDTVDALTPTELAHV